MRRLRKTLALMLFALGGCATPVAPPIFTTAPLAERVPIRAKGLRPVSAEQRLCGASALDDPILAQWLVAATLAEGPRGVEVPVFGCQPGFRAL